MLFNSYIFIFLFLPIALLGYYFFNSKKLYEAAKLFLTGMSLWFYAYFRMEYLGIILCSIALNYFCHLLMLKLPHKKAILAGSILGNLFVLFYFKYFDFLLENINNLFHTGFTLSGVLLPLGISFFTFQQIAFLIDTAQGSVSRQTIIDYALFVTFFPQLIAGPIVSPEEMLPQFRDISRKHFCYDDFYMGIRLFVLGLGKKVLLADTFGVAVNWGFRNYASLDGLNTILVILFYSFQIYLDFSGYCDMARGLGLMFRLRIAVNFLSPYKSANIMEFWNRWHITLTRFFTRYLYIPLGGNRKGKLRTYLNILIVFLCSGIWHGAGWTFLLWGLLHGTLNVLTRIWHDVKKQLHLKGVRFLHGVSVFFTFLFVTFAWTFFRADTVGQAAYMLRNLTSAFQNGWKGLKVHKNIAEAFQLPEFFYPMKFFKLDALPLSSCYCMFLFILTAVVLIFFCKNLSETESSHRPCIPGTIALSVIFVWCVLSFSGVSTFLYFNF